MSDHQLIGRLSHAHGIPYTFVARPAAQDNNLTLEARGLLTLFLSLPPNWKLIAKPIAERFGGGCSEKRIRTLMNELAAAGYLRRHQPRRDDGTLGPVQVEIRPTPDVPWPSETDPESPDGQNVRPADENRQAVEPLSGQRPDKRENTFHRGERKHPPARNDDTRPQPPPVETLDFGTRPDTNRAVAGVSELRHVLEATGQGPLCGTDPAPNTEHDAA